MPVLSPLQRGSGREAGCAPRWGGHSTYMLPLPGGGRRLAVVTARWREVPVASKLFTRGRKEAGVTLTECRHSAYMLPLHGRGRRPAVVTARWREVPVASNLLTRGRKEAGVSLRECGTQRPPKRGSPDRGSLQTADHLHVVAGVSISQDVRETRSLPALCWLRCRGFCCIQHADI